MKKRIVLMKKFIMCAVLVLCVGLSQAAVLYQSDFTGANLASAGLTATAGTNGYWSLDTVNDLLTGTKVSTNSRANVYTSNSWNSAKGFTLKVTFKNYVAMTRYSFGIVDAAFPVTLNTDCFSVGLAGAYGIGFATAGEVTYSGTVSGVGFGDSLVFNNGSGLGGDKGGSTRLSIGQGDITLNTPQTVSITVTPTGWSYSLNGARATTGTWATAFDTSRSYKFVAHSQLVEKQCISNVTLLPAESVIARDPDPGNRESQVEIDLSARDVSGELSWTAPEDYTPSGYDVYFGTTEPNDLSANYGLTRIGTAGQADTHAAPTAFLPLTHDTTYYWVVDSREPNTVGYINRRGSNWSFRTVSYDPAPTVVIDTLNTITWVNEPVQLNATVTDTGASPVTITWTSSQDPNTVFSDIHAEDPTVTVNRVFATSPYVTLTCSVQDGANPTPNTDTVVLRVYANACTAARVGAGRAALYPMDFTSDCVINLSDFADVAEEWLVDYALTDPIAVP